MIINRIKRTNLYRVLFLFLLCQFIVKNRLKMDSEVLGQRRLIRQYYNTSTLFRWMEARTVKASINARCKVHLDLRLRRTKAVSINLWCFFIVSIFVLSFIFCAGYGMKALVIKKLVAIIRIQWRSQRKSSFMTLFSPVFAQF